MKYNKFFIIIALCASFTQQMSFGMNPRYQPEGWTSWLTRQAQTAKSYASSTMSSLSKRMTNIYNKVNTWSTTTKANVFLATAGALIALGYDKGTLKTALDTGISATGAVSNMGLKIIQNPETATTELGLRGMGLEVMGQLKESSEEKKIISEKERQSIIEAIYAMYIKFSFMVPLFKYAMILNNLEDNAKKWEADLITFIKTNRATLPVPTEINIEDLVTKGMADKLIDLMKETERLNKNEDQQNLEALKKLNPIMDNKIKNLLRNNKEFVKKFTEKHERLNIQTPFDQLTLADILEIIYAK